MSRLLWHGRNVKTSRWPGNPDPLTNSSGRPGGNWQAGRATLQTLFSAQGCNLILATAPGRPEPLPPVTWFLRVDGFV